MTFSEDCFENYRMCLENVSKCCCCRRRRCRFSCLQDEAVTSWQQNYTSLNF